LLEILKYRMKLMKLLNEWVKWSKRIADASKEILGECKVFVFGSVVEEKAVGGSDVDILIVYNKLPESKRERAEIIAKIEEEAELPLYHPFEIHLVNEEEAKWYFRHINKFVRIL